jgi:xylitol oxidase
MSDQFNWAGNYRYSGEICRPRTVEQLQELVARSAKLKALGTRHSFNGIADTTGDLISLEQFEPVLTVDTERHTVTVGAGVRYGQLCRELHERGYALHNLASLPHISVAGACATGTHGSGDGNGNLATAVSGLEMVTADGEVLALSRERSRERDGARFLGAVVGLGALGVITQLTLDLVPAFEVAQTVYTDLPLAQLEDHFDAILSSAYSVSLFTDWREARFNQVWCKRRVGDPVPAEGVLERYGAMPATGPLHPIAENSAASCTEQWGVPGPWYERLPHFRMEYTPSNGEELQSEYFVPRRHACAALNAVYGLREQISPLLLISEVRTIAADDLWMSPCYGRDSVAIHFTWQKEWPAVERLLPQIEARLAPFEAIPHWGKLFTVSPVRWRALYPRLPDFLSLLESCDPQGKFRNTLLNTLLFGEVS